MSHKHLFIFGYGYSGFEIARQAQDSFAKITVTNRTLKPPVAPWEAKLERLLFDGQTLEDDVRQSLSDATHMVVSIAPGPGGDVVLKNCKAVLDGNKDLRWIGYLSTVGVYGHHDGQWVDETSKCNPVSQRSIQRLAAEQAWQTYCNSSGRRLAIFRLSGIYGPGRNAFVNMEKGTARRLVKPGQVFNRVHREDIGQAVLRAMEGDQQGIFNITDDQPAPPQDVVTFAHEIAGREPPVEIDFDRAELSPMARSFYGENKRVSNQKSKDVLGMVYRYPNFEVALKRLWDQEMWR